MFPMMTKTRFLSIISKLVMRTRVLTACSVYLRTFFFFLFRRLHNPAIVTSSPTTIYSRYKKRSSSLQRQELLQIIQANMEKNNLCFQTTRYASILKAVGTRRSSSEINLLFDFVITENPPQIIRITIRITVIVANRSQ